MGARETDTIEGNPRLTRESRGSLPFYANILLAIMSESTLVCEQGCFLLCERGRYVRLDELNFSFLFYFGNRCVVGGRKIFFLSNSTHRME